MRMDIPLAHHPPEHKLVDGRVKCTRADAIDLDDPRRRGIRATIGRDSILNFFQAAIGKGPGAAMCGWQGEQSGPSLRSGWTAVRVHVAEILWLFRRFVYAI